MNDERFPGGSKKVVQKLLKLHTLNGRYLMAIQQGGVRFSLDGTQAGVVSTTQREMAGVMLQRWEPGRG
ncbi:MAG TPA: ProQ/FINO family protein [Thiolinea sp.]|nr:ProQ/FINO family protein [Thiolinea sp.]